jgi:Leucine-rich repeat (LRR) protein
MNMKKIVFTIILLLFQFGYNQDIIQGLVAHYPFNGNTNDATGNGHNASTYSGYFTSDIHGNTNSAFYFSPDTGFIRIPYDTELQLSQFSLCGWVKCEFIGSGSTQTVISRGENVNGDSESLNYLLDIVRDTGQPMIRYEDANENPVSLSTTQLLETNQWHFLVSTYNGDSLKIFIDGNEAISIYGVNAPGSNANDLIIGATQYGGWYNNFFNGTLDDIRIYNRPLSNGEVYNLYMDGLPGIVRDSLALVALYNSTDGDNWNPPVNWITADITSWDGIYIENNRVVGIDLPWRNLNGTIPTTISYLDSLKDLSFHSNQNLIGNLPTSMGNLSALTHLGIYNTGISGSIPAELGQLTKLRYCNLSANQLSGSIPAELFTITSLRGLYLFDNRLDGFIPTTIGNLINVIEFSLQGNLLSGSIPDNFTGLDSLQSLFFNNNQLTGSIPASLGSCSELKHLGLWDNQLTGPIPAEIGNLNNLETMSLWNNQLNGDIPASIGNLRKLTDLHLGSNSLSGSIPSEIGNMSALRVLHIENDSLSGEIPSSIGNLLYLQDLELQGNKLTGNIPVDLGNDTTLVNLNLGGNALSGSIPSSLGSLHNLFYLNLADNTLSGDLPAEFWNLSNLRTCWLFVNQLTGTLPEQLGNLDSLEILDLGDNKFTGALPAAFSTLSKLRIVWIGNNDLTGTLPANIGNMISLEELALYGNSLSGSIPTSIGNCSKLRLLNLGNNQLDGSIPSEMGSLLNLEELWLASNTLTGNIPVSLENCSKLRILNLWTNQLTGTVPAELGSLSELIHLSLGINKLDGNIPSEIYTLTNLTLLSLDQNSFTGTIPTSIGNLVNLEHLYLGLNQLSGNIPSELGNLINLKSFELFDNNFSGELPTELGNLTSLERVYIANNNFTGDIPSGFSSFTQLTNLHIFENKFSGLPNLSSLPLTDLQVQDNQLTFEDIEPNVGISGIIYAPQDSVGDVKNHVINANDNVTMNVIVGGNNNQYQWFNGDTQIPNATAPSYQIVNADANDAGSYTCQITNSIAVQCTLWSRPVTVSVSGAAPPEPQLIYPPDYEDEVSTTFTFTWREATGAVSYEFQLAINSNFNPTVIQEAGVKENSFFISGLDENQLYYWRVIATYSFDTNDSDTWEFYTVSSLPRPDTTYLSSPKDGDVNQPLIITLKWDPESNSDNYYLQVAENSSFSESDFFIDHPNIESTSYDLSGLNYDKTYFWRVRAINAAGEGAWSKTWSFKTWRLPTINGGDPAEVTPVTIVLNGMVNPNGLETNVVFEIGESTAYGRTVQAEQNPISGTSEVNISAFIDNLYIGATYHYRLVATSNAGNVPTEDATFTTLTYPDQYTLALSTSFASKSEPKDYQPTDYRIVGLPGGSKIAVKDLMNGEPEKDWMVVWDNGTDANYFVRFNDSQEFKCLPGRAFWVVSKSPVTSGLAIETATLNNDDEVEIQVHKGWNLITNPFDSPVSWQYVQQHNTIAEPIHSFNGSWSTSNVMQPYQGYYYYHEPNTTMLRIPIHAAYTTPSLKNENPYEWKMDITLTTQNYRESHTSIGVNSEAEAGPDRFDYRKPRALGNIPGISFIRPDWDAKYQRFARDIRPVIEDVEKWEFDVTATRNEDCQLLFSNVDMISETQQVYVVDLMHASYQDLREDTVFSFKPVIDTSPFAIIVGDEAAVQEELKKILPQEFTLGHNFPNPFNPLTTIPVSVPQDAFVTIKIYTILGQEIETLFRGMLTTGRHYMTWNGRTQASGIYYCRLLSQSGKSATSKLVLVK